MREDVPVDGHEGDWRHSSLKLGASEMREMTEYSNNYSSWSCLAIQKRVRNRMFIFEAYIHGQEVETSVKKK